MKTCVGNPPSILTSSLTRFTSVPLYPYPLDRRVSKPQSRGEANMLPLSRTEPKFSSPSLYRLNYLNYRHVHVHFTPMLAHWNKWICTPLRRTCITTETVEYNYHNSGNYLTPCLLFKTRRFGDWNLSPSSSGTYSETISIYWVQLCTLHLKTETESSLRNAVFEMKIRLLDNVQNCDSYINIPLSQSYR
jgi:hypothetical protein